MDVETTLYVKQVRFILPSQNVKLTSCERQMDVRWMLLLSFFFTEIAIGVIFVILILFILGIVIFVWRWKKRQEKMEQLWLLQLERANNVSNSMVMPFRAV